MDSIEGRSEPSKKSRIHARSLSDQISPRPKNLIDTPRNSLPRSSLVQQRLKQFGDVINSEEKRPPIEFGTRFTPKSPQTPIKHREITVSTYTTSE